MLLERKTAKSVQLLLGDVQTFLDRCSLKSDKLVSSPADAQADDQALENFAAFSRQIYPRVHSAFYSSILSPADQWFVRKNGLPELFNCPLTTGEDDYLPGEKKRKVTTLDPVTVVIAQADSRDLFKLIHDLNLCFKSLQESPELLDEKMVAEFVASFGGPVAEALEVLS
jgi:hypothetical protein